MAGGLPDDTNSRLPVEVRYEIRKYVTSLVLPGAILAAAVAGAIGWFVNDLAKAQATASALREIQEPLIKGQVAVSEALSDAIELQEEVAAIDGLVDEKLDGAVSRSDEAIRRLVETAAGTEQQLKEASANARKNVRDAENELRRLRERIAAIPNVGDLTQSIESAAAKVAEDEAFQNIVTEKSLLGFTGMVAAFASECPAAHGWVPYEEGAGKFLLGVGAGSVRWTGPHERPKGVPPVFQLTPVSLGDQGGTETQILQEEEMPKHNHPGSGINSEHRIYQWLDFGKSTRYDNGTHKNIDTSEHGIRVDVAYSGGDQPHNNMPPYIALYFCKKEG